MEYAELKLYNQQGGDTFRKKNIDTKVEVMDVNDKQNLRKYKKKIIEQRNEIERLKNIIEELKEKSSKK